LRLLTKRLPHELLKRRIAFRRHGHKTSYSRTDIEVTNEERDDIPG
jgi:hypothetical protein